MKKELKEALVRIAGIRKMELESEQLLFSKVFDDIDTKADLELIERELGDLLPMLMAAGMLEVMLWDGPLPISSESESSWISFEPCDVWFDGGFRIDVNAAFFGACTGMSAGKYGDEDYFDTKVIQRHIDEQKKQSEEAKARLCEKHANGEQLSDAQKEYAGIVQPKKAKKKVAKKKAKSSAELH